MCLLHKKLRNATEWITLEGKILSLPRIVKQGDFGELKHYSIISSGKMRKDSGWV